MTLVACKNWGINHPKMTYSAKMRIARAASRLISYDAGYRFPFGYTDLMNWDRDIEKLLAEGGQSVTE